MRDSKPALGAPLCHVILDEQARGLDHPLRQLKVAHARELQKSARLFCIAHGVAGTRTFDRVLALGDGLIVEDGAPDVLAANLRGRYGQLRHLIEAEKTRTYAGQ